MLARQSIVSESVSQSVLSVHVGQPCGSFSQQEAAYNCYSTTDSVHITDVMFQPMLCLCMQATLWFRLEQPVTQATVKQATCVNRKQMSTLNPKAMHAGQLGGSLCQQEEAGV